MFQEAKDDENSDTKRRANRALTQRYDMHALRKIQTIEDDFRNKLAVLCDCEADDVPVDLDTLSIYNLEESQRRGALLEVFQTAPKGKDYTVLIDGLLLELAGLHLVPISSKK